MSVFAVGVSSFMAQAVRAHPGAADWAFAGHADALSDHGRVTEASCVVNFALDPRARAGEVTEDTNLDAKLARMIRDSGSSYVILSSRQVYGPAPQGGSLSETHAPAPITPYALAKLEIERSVLGILGPERVTTLRVANVFGYETGRRSFLGMALTRLRDENRIVYDMSPLTRRDFLSVERFADALVKICAAPKGGAYNLGSGIGFETGRIAEGLAEGYGGGELLATSLERRDEFRLDMTKSRAAWGLAPLSEEDVYADCVALGRELRAEKAAA